jgi:hypothetical protein
MTAPSEQSPRMMCGPAHVAQTPEATPSSPDMRTQLSPVRRTTRAL